MIKKIMGISFGKEESKMESKEEVETVVIIYAEELPCGHLKLFFFKKKKA